MFLAQERLALSLNKLSMRRLAAQILLTELCVALLLPISSEKERRPAPPSAFRYQALLVLSALLPQKKGAFYGDEYVRI